MGVFRVYPRYPGVPKRDTLKAVSDALTLEMECGSQTSLSVLPHADTLYSAFSHPTASLLMAWQYSGGTTKSADELDRLWTYIQDPAFNPTVDKIFSHTREKKCIDKYLADSSNPFNTAHGWQRSSVKIPLPHKRSKYTSEQDPELSWLMVDGIYHHDITDIIISAFQSKTSSTYHIFPYEEYWRQSSDSEPLRLFGKAYSSLVFIKAYQEIHLLPGDSGDNLERVVALLMLWSDAMQLANFGDASLWPIYLYLAN
ncbi:hypothetical protein J3R82DRAFT_8668 [Butyriboletus roseoflavus]|nr:hypothetical protein J3R82DRAFT_8668 [Butyriboletus roseoflavus]